MELDGTVQTQREHDSILQLYLIERCSSLYRGKGNWMDLLRKEIIDGCMTKLRGRS